MSSYEASQVAAVRGTLMVAGVKLKPADAKTIIVVLQHVGGRTGIAIDALLMVPRPAWLREKIGDALTAPAPVKA